MPQAANISRAYFRRLGKDTTSAEADTLAQFLSDLADIGVLHLATDAWSLRSAYNVGSGATVKGIFGRTDITLSNSPTWGTSGVTFNGTTQTGSGTLPTTQAAGTVIVVAAGGGSQPTSFASLASLAASTGRTTGGSVATILHNAGGPIIPYSYNGTSGIAGTTPTYLYYAATDTGFRFHAMTNANAAAAGSVTFHVDGCLASQQTAGGSYTGFVTATNSDRLVVAGSWNGAAAELFFSGTVAFAMVFKTQLTETQIQRIYASLRSTVCSGLQWVRHMFIDGDSQANAFTNSTATDRWHNKLSLTAGQRWYAKTWQSNTAASIPASSGQTSAQRLAAYEGLCPGQKPIATGDTSYYFLCVGVNDISSNLTAAATMANIQALCSKARRDGMKVILFGLPAWILNTNAQQLAEHKALQGLIRSFGQSSDVTLYVPLDTMFGSWNSANFVDGVHLGPIAQTAIANYIYAAIPTP